jgi:BMFP domain-containing protein YqiC
MSRPKFIDDLAGVAGGAMSALSGIGDEVEQLVRARIDEALRTMKLVRRDEFDAALEMAANARAGQEDAATRIAALERRVQALEMGGAAAVDAMAHDHEEGGLGGPPPETASPDAVPAAAHEEPHG